MINDIWLSFRSMPVWVQIWVALILVPVNSASIFFLSEPKGWLVALLAIGPMMANLVILFWERGLSKMMAIPHLLPWTILVFWIMVARPEGSGNYDTVLTVILLVNFISLGFDYVDAIKWLEGDRKVAGRT